MAIAANVRFSRCQSRKLGYEIEPDGKFALLSCRATSSAGRGYGSGFSSTALTIEKSAVFAPIPRASVSSATAVNPGALPSTRSA